jgi:hypothetical protein
MQQEYKGRKARYVCGVDQRVRPYPTGGSVVNLRIFLKKDVPIPSHLGQCRRRKLVSQHRLQGSNTTSHSVNPQGLCSGPSEKYHG